MFPSNAQFHHWQRPITDIVILIARSIKILRVWTVYFGYEVKISLYVTLNAIWTNNRKLIFRYALGLGIKDGSIMPNMRWDTRYDVFNAIANYSTILSLK